ncbi:MAG: hypothetical protein JXR83_16405 [Deltaproteobacteria bacterium]|nr:hypothetical protein [Deltaproteobacteria bacterium]
MAKRFIPARVFRPALWLRVPVLIALVLWIAVTLFAIGGRIALPVTIWLELSFFVALFSVVVLYYWSMRITVDDNAITYQGVLAVRTCAFDEILEIRVFPIPGLTNYSVFTRATGLSFTSLIAGHKDLFDLIVSRSRLSVKHDL